MKNKKILFLHGFASCGLGQKSQQLTQYFGKEQVITPDLSHIPAQAIQQASRIIQQENIHLLVGTSLGGYYALVLNAQKNIPSVLINPAVKPWQLLTDYIGWHQRWCDGKKFEFTAEYAHQLQSMFRLPKAQEQYLVLLQKGDEVLDYRQAENLFHQHKVISEAKGNHRFHHIEHYLDLMNHFTD